jgi:hypothetical protein
MNGLSVSKRLFGIGLALCVGACASWYMKGSSPAKGAPPSPVGTFKITKCTTTSGEEIAGPQATYYLAAGKKGGLALYEIDATGDGAEISNHWQDEQGHHFVTYVANSHGWHYVIPDEPGKPGKRLVHPAGSYTVQNVAGTMRLMGEPAASCEMVPEGGQPTPADTTTAPVPTPSVTSTDTPPPPATTDGGTTAPPVSTTPTTRAVCAPGATQECVGVGACKGGQQCRDDGTGWGQCDCGKR